MEWISVKEMLPELKREVKSYFGNRFSDAFLVTDGEKVFIADLMALSPSFETMVWVETHSCELVSDYTDKEITHLMELPKLP